MEKRHFGVAAAKYKAAVLFFAALSFSPCVCYAKKAKDAAPPLWYPSPREVYPADKYIVTEVPGSGKNAAAAKNDAVSALAGYISTQVQAATVSTFQSVLDEEKTKQTMRISQKVKTTVDTKLFALETTEPYRDKAAKKWYVAAFIDREKAFEMIRPQADAAKEKALRLCNAAKEAGDVFAARSIYSSAREAGEEFLDKVSYASLFNDERVKREYKDALTIVLTFLSSPVAVLDLSSATVCVLSPHMEGINDAESVWLSGSVQDKTLANLRTYTMFTLLDRDSSLYALSSTIRQTSKGYTLSASFDDKSTGEKIASAVSSLKKDAVSLFSGAGSAADEITASLCEQLGISLSYDQKYVLQHGEEDLSVTERLEMTRNEMAAFKKQMANLDKQTSQKAAGLPSGASSAVSGGPLESAALAKLETERALAEERYKASAQKAQWLEAEIARRLLDAKTDDERSMQIKQRRDALSLSLAGTMGGRSPLIIEDKKANKTAEEAIMERLGIIESKKRALVQIHESVKMRTDEIKRGEQEDISARKEEILSKEYRSAELRPDGSPTDKALEMRQAEAQAAEDEVASRAKQEIMDVTKAVQSQDNALTKEINQDIKGISRKYTASSRNGSVKVSFGPYDGERQSWEATVYVYSGEYPLTSFAEQVNYSALPALEGKENPTQSGDYEGYLDTVDIYNSLFCRGDPILTFEVDYSVAPDASKLSEYTFTFSQLRVLDTRDEKTAYTRNISAKRNIKFEPPYDIRPISEQEESKERAEKKMLTASRRDDYRDVYGWAYNTLGGGGMTGLAVSAGTKHVMFNASIAILPWVYLGGAAGFNYVIPETCRREIKARSTAASKYDMDDLTLMTYYGYLGANFSLCHIRGLHPVLYGTVGIGKGRFMYEKKNKYFSDSSDGWKEAYSSQMFVQTAGIAQSVPFTHDGSIAYQIFVEFVRQDFKDKDTTYALSAGFKMLFPKAAVYKIFK